MNRLSYALGIILLLVLSGICTVVAVAQEAPLTNAEIVKLTKLEMGDAVIIAKIKAAKEVKFDTGTDDLVKLREAGVSKDVIAAMIEKTAPPPTTAGARPEIKVQLQSAEGLTDLKAVYGLMKTQSAPFSVQSWIQFVDLQAKIRVKDSRPSILLALDRDPRGGWWFVRLTQYKRRDDVYRFFDLEGGGGAFSVTWSGKPEKGSIVPYEAIEEQPGLWRIKPLKDLRPGEYGLFAGAAQAGLTFGASTSGVLYDFGIDVR